MVYSLPPTHPIMPSPAARVCPHPSDPDADPACRGLPVGPWLGCLWTNIVFK